MTTPKQARDEGVEQGQIEAFEWAILATRHLMDQPEETEADLRALTRVELVTLTELDRRYPKPNRRRSL